MGRVWATHKDPQLTGVKLYILQPVNEKKEAMGKPILAADTVGSREDDLVYWVSSREASFAMEGKKIPSDASIVGIVDNTFAKDKRYTNSRLKKWKEQNLKQVRG